MESSLKAILVTGAASGLGRAVVLRLAAPERVLFCLDRDRGGLEELGRRIEEEAGATAELLQADVASPDSIAAAFEIIGRSNRTLDGLVTCAAVTSTSGILDLTLEEWDRVMDINLRGTFLCVQHALQIMIPKGFGRIVTVGSDVGKRGGGRLAKSAYGASKGGVIALTRSLARELAAVGLDIRINCVCPGPMRTAMHEGLSAEEVRRVEASVPLGRFGAPGEVAAAIGFMLSDAASFIYGETLNVDGGVVMD